MVISLLAVEKGHHLLTLLLGMAMMMMTTVIFRILNMIVIIENECMKKSVSFEINIKSFVGSDRSSLRFGDDDDSQREMGWELQGAHCGAYQRPQRAPFWEELTS